MKIFNAVSTVILYTLLISCSSRAAPDRENREADNTPSARVIVRSALSWEKLNPARGDKSPQAANLWGDRKLNEPTGFLVKFVDGFSSPPHIHNVTYRAVVLSGLIHNDDPAAEKMWMQPGSFWTQPEGANHITAAKGTENIALVEIDSGPYLVNPPSQAYENGEQPVNIDVSNISWINGSDMAWVNTASDVAVSYLWKKAKKQGLFIKLPRGFDGVIETKGNVAHGVIIAGGLYYYSAEKDEQQLLDLGSYFGSSDAASHRVVSAGDEETTFYMSTNGALTIK